VTRSTPFRKGCSRRMRLMRTKLKQTKKTYEKVEKQLVDAVKYRASKVNNDDLR